MGDATRAWLTLVDLGRYRLMSCQSIVETDRCAQKKVACEKVGMALSRCFLSLSLVARVVSVGKWPDWPSIIGSEPKTRKCLKQVHRSAQSLLTRCKMPVEKSETSGTTRTNCRVARLV